jgi:hypothetical protein
MEIEWNKVYKVVKEKLRLKIVQKNDCILETRHGVKILDLLRKKITISECNENEYAKHLLLEIKIKEDECSEIVIPRLGKIIEVKTVDIMK